MWVYRVQNIHGRGPYYDTTENTKRHDMLLRHDRDHIKYPCPDVEGLDFLPGKHLCCFVNIQQLYLWFSHTEIEFMADDGYYIVAIKAKVIVASDKQALIFKDRPNKF